MFLTFVSHCDDVLFVVTGPAVFFVVLNQMFWSPFLLKRLLWKLLHEEEFEKHSEK